MEIDPWDNDYGRSPFTVLSSFRDKLSYAIAEYCGNNYSRIESYIKSEKIFDDIFNPLLINLIGCDEIEYGKNDYRRFEIYSDVGGEYLDEVEQVPYDNLIYVEKENRDDISDDELVAELNLIRAEITRRIEEKESRKKDISDKKFNSVIPKQKFNYSEGLDITPIGNTEGFRFRDENKNKWTSKRGFQVY